MRCNVILLAILLCVFPMRAAETAPQQIAQAYQFWKMGQGQAAIAILEPLLRFGQPLGDARDTGSAWNVLGSSYQDAERYDEARRAYQHAVEAFRGAPDARAQYASALDNLGMLEQSLGQHQEARTLCEKSQHIYDEVGSARGIAITSTNLAVIAYTSDDFKAARRFVVQATAEAQKAIDMRGEDLAALDTILGALSLHDGRAREAIAHLQRAIDQWLGKFGPNYFMLVNGYLLRAQALALSGDRPGAIRDAKHAMSIADSVLGKNSTGYWHAEESYSGVLRMCGDKEESKRISKEASAQLAPLERRQCSGCTMDASSLR
jgi:tetratricopeptide (TPR) repeat protein